MFKFLRRKTEATVITVDSFDKEFIAGDENLALADQLVRLFYCMAGRSLPPRVFATMDTPGNVVEVLPGPGFPGGPLIIVNHDAQMLLNLQFMLVGMEVQPYQPDYMTVREHSVWAQIQNVLIDESLRRGQHK